MSDNQVYARVHQGKAIELNVTQKQIADRGETKASYLPLYYSFPPKKVPAYHVLKQVTAVFQDHVQVNYQAVPMSLEQLLMHIWNTNGDLRRPVASVAIGDLSTKLVDAIASAAVTHMQEALDAFAKSRGYDDIKSAVTYVDSVVPTFAAEGAAAKNLRDQSWAALYSYLNDVKNGVKPVPKNVAEIVANCPALTW